MQILTPELVARALLFESVSGNDEFLQLDFSLGANVGIMINEVDISTTLRGILPAATDDCFISFTAAIDLDPDNTGPDPVATDAFRLRDSRLMYANGALTGGTIGSSTGAALTSYTFYKPQSWRNSDPVERPITTRAMTAELQISTTGFTGQSAAASFTIRYQLVKLDDTELIRVVATRF